jgi:hypothetical protein
LEPFRGIFLAGGQLRRADEPLQLQTMTLSGRIGLMLAVKGSSMEKWLCWGSLGVAGLLLLLFLLDLFTQFPFQRISPTVDVISILCCGVLGYLAWNALKDMG